MFCGSPHALGFDAIDHGCGHFARNHRIFRIVFEISAAKRIAVDIHSGAQQKIDTIFQHFVAHGLPDFVYEIRIPGGCQQRRHGKAVQ